MAKIVDLASKRHPDPAILLVWEPAGYSVRLEPPADRPGARDEWFPSHGPARRYAEAMKILLPDRRIRVELRLDKQADPPGPAAA